MPKVSSNEVNATDLLHLILYVVTYIMLHQHLYSLSFKTTVSDKKNKGAVLKTCGL